MSRIANQKNAINLGLIALTILSLIAISADLKSVGTDGIIVEPALVYAASNLEADS